MKEYLNLDSDFTEVSALLRETANRVDKQKSDYAFDLTLAQERMMVRLKLDSVVKRIEYAYRMIRNTLALPATLVNYEPDIGFLLPEDKIEISRMPEIVSITLPGLLPLRTKVYANYLPMKLNTIMERERRRLSAKGERFPFFEKAAVVFLHHLVPAEEAQRTCDYDNLERKSILDLLRTYLFYSDNMASLVSTDISVESTRNYTKIFVFDFHEYPTFIDMLNNETSIFKNHKNPS